MSKVKLTTLQIDAEIRDRLADIAKANRRSMTGQIEWMVMQEYVRLLGDPRARVVEITDLPGPEGCTPVPLVTVAHELEPQGPMVGHKGHEENN